MNKELANSEDSNPIAATVHLGYFQEFLPTIIGELLLDYLEGFSACIELNVTDGKEPPWRLTIESGRLTAVRHDGPEPDCSFELDSGTFMRVVSGQYAPQEAFFDMGVEIEGDLEMGLNLNVILGPFFERYPYLPDAS